VSSQGTSETVPVPVAPAPIAPSTEVAGIGTPARAPNPVTPPAPIPAPAPAPAPKVVTVVPWARTPVYVPPPPVISLPPIGSSSPVVLNDDRQSGLALAITAKAPAPGATAVLPRPGVDATTPDAIGALGSAPKTAAPVGTGTTAAVTPTLTNTPAPTETATGPVSIASKQPTSVVLPLHASAASGLEPIAPLTTTSQPRLALSSPTLPGLAKAAAPVGDLKTPVSGRMSLPTGTVPTTERPAPVATGRQTGLAPLAVAPPRAPVTRVEPVGPAVATTATAPPALQPLTTITPEKTGPTTGPARVTVPDVPVASRTIPTAKPAPTKVAVGVRPPAAPLITDAALAEYRGLPVPAYRMTARLPESGVGSVAADGRTTTPAGNVAAIPVAVAKVRDIKIVFDGEVLSLRATPETRRGISLAPLREIFEQTDGVLYWFPVEKQVRAVNKGVDMSLKIGDPKITVNGEDRVLQIAPYIKRGRTMVPLQFIADLLDVNIAVNSATGDIMISSNQL
jgi:hypothetical protein